MSVNLRFTPVDNLLGLRIDNESDDGAESPGVIVIFREESVSMIGTTVAGIHDAPIEDEPAVGIDLC